jgi:glutathione S-transferase
MDIAGKIALVTGGAQGIGLALALALKRAGAARVVIADLRLPDDTPQGVDEALVCDVSDPAQIAAMIDHVEAAHGPIDIMCSNAGIATGMDTTFDNIAFADPKIWDRAWAVNVMAHVHAARVLIPRMKARGDGYFLHTISAAGLLSQVGSAVYSTTKHAAVGFAESLAIAEELASRHPDAGLWPKDPDTRAVARALAAEMHAGFSALRSHCPMNLRVSYTGCEPPQAVLDDLARLEQIWAWARATTGATGDLLCGDYSVADVFFAPVAARIAGYGLPVGAQASAYVAAHLAHPSFRRWRAMGMVDGADQAYYKRDYPTRPWPGPTPLPARAVAQGPSVNAACPYSGDPVTDFAEIEGRIWGFCNPFCRDKTVADALAWPKFAALLRQ